MYRISYRFLFPGWSAKPLVSAHDRIMGTDRPAGARCVIAALTDNRALHDVPAWIQAIDMSEQAAT